MTPQRKALLGLLTEFPNAATKTLALTAFKRWPALWHSVEAVRTSIRTLRGANGEASRKQCTTKEMYRTPRKSGDPFSKLPEPREQLHQWGVLEIPGPMKALVLSDVHVPYHSTSAVRAALKYGRDEQCNVVLLNGDIADCFSVSRWETDPRERNFADELRDVKAFLQCVRDGFPRARIVYKIGNHEERYLRYMQLKAPELLGIADFELATVFGLKKLGIELVENNSIVRIGKLNVIHGHEYRFAISNPVNPARGLFMRGKCHAICGHFHQTSQHSEKSLEQHVMATWSTGCLCDLHPEYRPLNNWNHGFLIAGVDKAGAFEVDNLRIDKTGKVWH